MAADRISKDISYLTDAAYLLRHTAPEASAHLMRQRSELMFQHNLKPHDTQRQHVCGACGHIMIPQKGTEIKLRKGLKRTKSLNRPLQGDLGSSTNRSGLTKTVECGLCHRATMVSIDAPERIMRRKAQRKTGLANISQADPDTEAKGKPSANASSRKRAKNRKGGLQALLSNQQQKSAGSLSLADFMK